MKNLYVPNLFPPDYPEDEKSRCLEKFKDQIFIAVNAKYETCPNVSHGLVLKKSESFELRGQLMDPIYIPDNAEDEIPLDYFEKLKWENYKVCILNPYDVKFFYTEYDAKKYFDDIISKNKPATTESSGSSDEIDDFTESDEDGGFPVEENGADTSNQNHAVLSNMVKDFIDCYWANPKMLKAKFLPTFREIMFNAKVWDKFKNKEAVNNCYNALSLFYKIKSNPKNVKACKDNNTSIINYAIDKAAVEYGISVEDLRSIVATKNGGCGKRY